MTSAETPYEKCEICPRGCGVDRTIGPAGFCSSASVPMIAHYGPHHWEEPPISGLLGSGTVFFSGCNLRCSYCQNRMISMHEQGKRAEPDEMASLFLELGRTCQNINLVTAAHHLPKVAEALIIAKRSGLEVPIVYNTSSYEKVDALRELNGLVDIYLPDMKYSSVKLSEELSHAPDYFEVASKAIIEMLSQVGHLQLSENGIATKGLLLRHLVLPGQKQDSIKILEWAKKNLGKFTSISIMSQYTPDFYDGGRKELMGRIDREEYHDVVLKAIDVGFQNIYIQDLESASSSYVPKFNLMF